MPVDRHAANSRLSDTLELAFLKLSSWDLSFSFFTPATSHALQLLVWRFTPTTLADNFSDPWMSASEPPGGSSASTLVNVKSLFRKLNPLPTNIVIGGRRTPWRPKLEYLGIMFQTRLTFRYHFDQAISKFLQRRPTLASLLCWKSSPSLKNKILIHRFSD